MTRPWLIGCVESGTLRDALLDRGNGKGVTVERIKADLNATTNNAELQACRKHYGRHIATLKRSSTEGAKVMAIQIENLVDYLYAGFRYARR